MRLKGDAMTHLAAALAALFFQQDVPETVITYLKQNHPGYLDLVVVSNGEKNPLSLLKDTRVVAAKTGISCLECDNCERAVLAYDEKTSRVTALATPSHVVDFLQTRAEVSNEEEARVLIAAALTLLRLQHPMAHSDSLFPAGKDAATWLDIDRLAVTSDKAGWTLADVDFRIGHQFHLATFLIDRAGKLSDIRLVDTGKR